MNKKGVLFLVASFLTMGSMAQNTNVANNTSSVSTENAKKSNGAKRIIPVVFHIIHQYRDENIPNEAILRQLVSLNKDFSMTNADVNDPTLLPDTFKHLATSMDIEFRLAKKDPQGKPTNGIERIASFMTWGDGISGQYKVSLDELKESSSWDSRKYLNVWVVKSLPKSRDAVSNAVSPYQIVETISNKPTKTDSSYSSACLPEFRAFAPSHDGIVLAYNFIGDSTDATVKNKYDAGRALTKCVGHWLGLKNLWADADCGNDGVEDTPKQFGQNRGVPVFPLKNLCYTGADTIAVDKSQMFMNFMDYTDGNHRVMFTAGQKQVVDNILVTLRKGIADNANLVATGVLDTVAPQIKPEAAIYMSNKNIFEKPSSGPTAVASVTGVVGNYTTRVGILNTDSVVFTDSTVNCNVKSRVWSFPGGTPSTSTAKKVTVFYTTPGSYDVTLEVTADTDLKGTTLFRNGVNAIDSNVARYDMNQIDSLPDSKNPAKYKYYYSYSENFEGIDYVTDKGWAFNHIKMNDNDSVDWRLDKGHAYSGQTSLMLPLNNNRNHSTFGDVYELISPPISFRRFIDSATISFRAAYAKRSAIPTQEKLYISYSVNGGREWFPFDVVSSATAIDYDNFLSGGLYYGEYYPASSAEWREFRITPGGNRNIENRNDKFKNKVVMFKFRFTCGAGQSLKSNNMFLDDFKICTPLTIGVGINEQEATINNLSVYPVPTNDLVKINFTLAKSEKVQISVTSIIGQELKLITNQNLSDGLHQYIINNEFGAGIYLVKIQSGQNTIVKKIIFN